MPILSDVKREFILRFKDRLSNRSFLIDVLTQVSDSPTVIVHDTNIHNTRTHVLTVGVEPPPEEKSDVEKLLDNTDKTVTSNEALQYIPPPKEIPKGYEEDEVMKWRVETGIDIVREHDDPYALIWNYNNWLLMPDAMKKESDKMCMKHFYYNNKDYFKVLIKKFIAEDKLKLGDISILVVAGTDKACRVFLDKIEGDDIPEKLHFRYLDNGEGRPFNETDTFTLKKGDIENFNEKNSITTTVGRFLLNQMLLVEPFNDNVPYINGRWKIGDVNKSIADKVMKDELTVQQLKSYLDRLYFIGHFSEICVPALSRKSLGTHEDVPKVKKQLIEKYKGNLDDPLVISEIESKLLELDKKHLEGDSAMRFYGALGGNMMKIDRKKLYLTVGGIETFSNNKGEFTFLPNSLEEGWDKSYIEPIANEIRRGSYFRGHETQLGGLQTKLITRVLQDLSVNMPDCNTVKGLVVDFDKIDINKFIGRWIFYAGEWQLITEKNLDKFKGRQKVRSPMYCEAPKGLCQKCVGEYFRQLSVQQVAVLAISISSTFLMLSMKSMHGTKLEMTEIKDFKPFVIE